MAIRHLHFTDEREAVLLEGDKSAAIISITDPDLPQPYFSDQWGSILRLSFNDAEYDHAMIRTYDRVADFREQHSDDPQPEHARAIQQYLGELSGKGIERVVVHCRYGRSRSAAIAKYVVEEYNTTLEGRSLDEYNRTLYLLLKNPMTFETALQNLERAEEEAAAQEASTGVLGTLKAFAHKWFGASN